MLTDAECRNAVCPPDKKQARFADAGGMYLQVSPAGSKRWFLKYRIAGAEKQLALGSYPAVTLTAARKARDAAKLQKSAGHDPVQVRKVEKLKATRSSGDTFKAVAWSFFGVRRSADYERDVQKLNPVHVVIAGVISAALFVGAVVVLVRWVVSSGVAT